jgi:hypothetical protein
MSGKIIWTGVALSMLGLGYFFKPVIIVGAVVLCIGVVLMWLDK